MRVAVVGLPFVLASEADVHKSAPIRVLISLLGVAGLVAAGGVLARANWATRLALAVAGFALFHSAPLVEGRSREELRVLRSIAAAP